MTIVCHGFTAKWFKRVRRVSAGAWWQLLQKQSGEEIICERWCLGCEGYHREGWSLYSCHLQTGSVFFHQGKEIKVSILANWSLEASDVILKISVQMKKIFVISAIKNLLFRVTLKLLEVLLNSSIVWGGFSRTVADLVCF